MTTTNSFQTDKPELHGSIHTPNPGERVESDQVVVLIRLPHLPSRERAVSQMAENAVPAPDFTETKIGIQPQTPLGNEKKHGRLYKYEPKIGIQPKTQLGQGSSGTAADPERRFPPWFSAMVRLAADSKRRLASTRVPVSAWKTAGFVAIMVLMLSALLLPRGGTSGRTERATDEFAEVYLPVVSMEVDMPFESEEAENSASMSSAASAKAAEEEPPIAEPESRASKNVVPKLEPMTPSDDTETGPDKPAPLAPEEMVPLAQPEAEPKTPSPTGPATTAAAMGDPTSPKTPVSDGATAQNDHVGPTEPPARPPQVPAQEAWSQQNYPATEPSTYQYPSHYERLLSNAQQGFHEESHPSSSQQSSIYGWQPSTVRLQPRIEPPPIR